MSSNIYTWLLLLTQLGERWVFRSKFHYWKQISIQRLDICFCWFIKEHIRFTKEKSLHLLKFLQAFFPLDNETPFFNIAMPFETRSTPAKWKGWESKVSSPSSPLLSVSATPEQTHPQQATCTLHLEKWFAEQKRARDAVSLTAKAKVRRATLLLKENDGIRQQASVQTAQPVWQLVALGAGERPTPSGAQSVPFCTARV